MNRENDATTDARVDEEPLSDDDIDRIVSEGLQEREAPEGQVKVLECPDCGKSDLSYVAGMETGHQYQCPHCGYQGALAVERYRSVDELREQTTDE